MVKSRNRVCIITLFLFIFLTIYQPLKLFLQGKVNQFNIRKIQPSSQTTGKMFEDETKAYPRTLSVSKTSLPYQTTKKVNETKATAYQNKLSNSISVDGIKPYLKYPLNIDMVDLLKNIQKGKQVNQKKINAHNFTYIQNPSRKCTVFNMNNTGGYVSNILILVKSHPNNFHFRIWMRAAIHHKTRVRMFFLIGHSTSFNIALKSENTIYDDIIQMDFQDSYRNLTFKTMMGYQWAAEFCPEAQYVLFQDDDFYINVNNLIKFLQQQEYPERVFVGHLIQESKFIYRKPKDKWYLSTSDYPFNVLPPYFPGGAYVVSMYLTKMLSLALPYVKWIPIDDVYIGIVAAKLNISLTDSKLFRFDKCTNTNNIIACHKIFTVKEILDIWRQSIMQFFLKDLSST